MPNIRIVKLKIRRGSEAERRQIVLEQAELGYTTDTRRLFVGNGSLSGGEVVGSKVHSVLASSNTRNLISDAYQGDLVYENNFLYQLTGTDYSKLTSWGFVGSRVDDSSIEYDGLRQISVKDSGISTAMIQNSAVTLDRLNTNILYSSGGLGFNRTQGISANIDNTIFSVTSANVITIKEGGITSFAITTGAVTQSEINSSALSKGLVGGSGAALSAHVDNDTIIFNSNNQISVGTIDATNINLGTGMEAAGNSLTHFIQTVNETNLNVVDYRLDLTEKLTYNNRQYNSPNIVVDKAGLIRSISNNICLPLSSNNSTFAGFATQLSGRENGNTTVIASTGVGASNISLSSAGFMVVRMGTPNNTTGDTRSFLNSQYVAIPIFTIPQSIINLAQEVETLIYPYTFFGFRAYDAAANGPYTFTGELSTGILTGAVCSGYNDYTGYSEQYDIYTNTSSLSIGTVIAATVNSLSTDEIRTLSGWWSFGSTLYFVNSTNTITITGNC
jgi:hypothetical protein